MIALTETQLPQNSLVTFLSHLVHVLRDEAGAFHVMLCVDFAGRMPILGVCLGHQAIGQVFGGKIVAAQQLMHGKVDQIEHNSMGVFTGLPSPITATRYHSLVIEPSTLPKDFIVDAWAAAPGGGREIMAIRHRELPVYGVQFHPESFLTPDGHEILKAFLATTRGSVSI